MSIYFFTDPHLGVTRHSHTTVPSRQRLKDAVFDVVGQVLAQAGQAPVICLGDLFDTTTNDEATIYQGMVTAKRCAAILAGNHDLPNREGKLSSLQLLSTFNDQVIRGHLDSPGFQFQLLEGTGVYFVPHMATQELFDQSLSEVTAYARANPQPQTLLCLHCNYNSGLIHNDASLNLTRERAEQLLESFTYVLLGHEHIPRTDFGGRLLILGNTHPTSFSDISDKWLWKLEGGQFEQIPLWSQADGYRAIAFDALADTAIAAGVQFVDVTGSATLEQMPDIAQQVAHLWRDHPGLLMVRNAVECATSLAAIEVETHKHLDLPSRISTALEGNDLLPLWTHYLGAAQ